MARRRRLASEGESGTYSRQAGRNRYSAARQRRGKRSRVRLALLGVVVALALVVAGLVAYAFDVQGRLHAGLPDNLGDSLSKTGVSAPFYMLFVGVDHGIEELGEDAGSLRADAIILARVDAPERKLTLVSIARETMVDLGASGRQKFAATYAAGGAAYTAKVASQFAGVPIAHYAEFRYNCLEDVVDGLGGITVDVPTNVVDPTDTGAELEAGYQEIDGQQALQLCRARHAYDTGENGESFRAANQRAVLAGVLDKIVSQNLPGMVGALSGMTNGVSCDLGLFEIAQLASSYRGFNRGLSLLGGQNPTQTQELDGVEWEVTNRTAWREMMLRVGQGLAPVDEAARAIAEAKEAAEAETPPTPGTPLAAEDDDEDFVLVAPLYEGTVRVLNASTKTGLAANAADQLKNAGFVTSTGNASEKSDRSIVIYATPADEGKAVGVVETLDVDMTIRAADGSYSMSTDVLVILGADQVT